MATPRSGMPAGTAPGGRGLRCGWQLALLGVLLAAVLVASAALDWRSWVADRIEDRPVWLALSAWPVVGLPMLALGGVGLLRRRSNGGRPPGLLRTPPAIPPGVLLLQRGLVAVSCVPVLVLRPARTGNAEVRDLGTLFGLPLFLCIIGAIVIEIGLHLTAGRTALAGTPSPAPTVRAVGSGVLLVLCLLVGVAATVIS